MDIDLSPRFPGQARERTECPACHAKPVGLHQCGFADGVFRPTNWTCATLAALAAAGTHVPGDEVDTWVIPAPDGSAVILVSRVGQAQRVRQAWVVGPTCEPRGLTLVFANTILRGTNV